MGEERNSLLRRTAPLAAVMLLLVPATASATSGSPDPPPGSKTLEPDAAPVATPAPAPKPARTTARAVESVPVARRSVPAPVVRTVVVHTPAPVVHRTVVKKAPPRARPKPAAARPKPRLVLPTLPPVLVPRFIESPLERGPSQALAALALGLAALTALSGAGLVFSWSRG
jgi:hypothetical protein